MQPLALPTVPQHQSSDFLSLKLPLGHCFRQRGCQEKQNHSVACSASDTHTEEACTSVTITAERNKESQLQRSGPLDWHILK